jgi:hypothetical protein
MCSAIGHVRFTPKADIVSDNSCIASLIFGCARSPQTGNKIIQKELASSPKQSGTVSSSGRWPAFRDPAPPAALLRWASVVTAMVAAHLKEIPDDQGKGEA